MNSLKSSLYFLVPIFFLSVFGTGCGGNNSSSGQALPSDASVRKYADDIIKSDQSAKGVAVLAGKRVEIENRDALKPGSINLALKLFGADGGELKSEDLNVVHDKRLHLLLVRDDMTWFQHLHPEYMNEKWAVTTTIPEQGDYQLYFDTAPTKESPVVLRAPVRIGGPTLKKAFPVPNPELAAVDQAIKATLDASVDLKTGEAQKLVFSLTENGQPVKDIDPYLGAFGHVVLLRHNEPDDFVHVHPITAVKPIDGKVAFETAFVHPGRYTLYAQFNIRGAVKTFPITVDVKASEASQMHQMDHHAH